MLEMVIELAQFETHGEHTRFQAEPLQNVSLSAGDMGAESVVARGSKDPVCVPLHRSVVLVPSCNS